MNVKGFIDKVLITLEIGDQTALLIMLSRSGEVHRKGNGNPDSGLPLIQHISHDGHFDALMMTIPEEVFQFAGLFRQPNPAGKECTLTIIFQGQNEVDFPFRVVYGHDSEGPPQELADILINAVKITEPFYQRILAEEHPQPERRVVQASSAHQVVRQQVDYDKKAKWWQVWK